MRKKVCLFQYLLYPMLSYSTSTFLVLVVLRRQTTNGSIKLIGDVAYDARFSVCNKRYTMYFEVQSQDIIIRHFVTSPFKSMCFQIFLQRLLSQNNRSYSRKKVPNEHKLIYAIYNLIVASWCLLFSYGSHLNTTTNLNDIFFGDVYLAPINIVIF